MLYLVVSIALLLMTAVSFNVVSKGRRGAVAVLGLIVFAVFTVASSVAMIDNSKTGVEKVFGRTVQSAYAPGFHLVAPWSSITRYESLRREFTFEGDVITKDNNPLHVTVGFATKLNPQMAWRVQMTVGTDYFENLVKTAAMTAVRDGISAFPWTKAVTSDRGEVQVAIQRNFERVLAEQFVANGLTEAESQIALSVSPVQLRSALPDRKVLNAVAERSAAEQDLERQEVLTQIAAEEANRRKNEGAGVSNLFSQLPEGFTSSEIAEVLGALAQKTRADAMLKAVESNQVGTIIINGDTGGGIAPAIPVKEQESSVPETPAD